jgi:hypothetical protein
MSTLISHRYQQVIEEMANLDWSALTRAELMAVAGAYHYYSVHFCETVDIACDLYPGDRQLILLREGECETDNLSPYPGVAEEGERMNHDEFMRRVFAMSSLDKAERERVERLGLAYLSEVRRIDPLTRVRSLPTYEDGGLEKVFRAVLRAEDWDEPSLRAFHHFLVGHIQLDSDPQAGHGSLCRHLASDDSVLPLWSAFRDLLVGAAPRLAGPA